MRKWKVDDSIELYGINSWGKDYFSINEDGNVTVTPKEGGPQIDLKKLMKELQLHDVSSPVLLRFPDILRNRIAKITQCFESAAKEYEYNAQSYVIYPIKVNQMRPVVEELVSHGNEYNVGLEAGSKPELHAVLSINIDNDSLIICNGYKDESYIELALLAQKMGRKIFLVVEKLMELRIIASLSKKLNVKPNIGIRIKLASSGSGKWEESGGDTSKFGLNSSELLEALELLEKEGLKDSFRLIHFHIGSQITNIRRIKTALKEATQFYAQLRKMNYNVEFIDIGGGLGVNYDGTRSSNSGFSINYSIQEYVNDAIYSIVDICKKNNLEQPNMIIESGRSLTAHHSVLVFEVLAGTHLPEFKEDDEIPEDAHELVRDLYDIWDNLRQSSLIEQWHDALQAREEALELFNMGFVDLQTRALVERLFWSIAREVNAMSKSKHAVDELKMIARRLPDKYFCNFSLFQSLPDSWAIDQIFPVMPLSRLDERPQKYATLQDITCDSDGKIANFISTTNESYHLPVHELKEDEPYYIGTFLVGAYQEILGDLHNLFGDTTAVHIKVNGDEYSIDKIIEGETIADVLDYVQFDPKRMVRSIELWVNRSVKSGAITPEEGREFISNYRSGLYGYTYLETE